MHCDEYPWYLPPSSVIAVDSPLHSLGLASPLGVVLEPLADGAVVDHRPTAGAEKMALQALVGSTALLAGIETHGTGLDIGRS